MLSKKVSGADNQQAKKDGRISEEYLAGFVDGEGCFYVGFSKRNDLPLKWQIITEFHVSQNPGGLKILEALRVKVGCGYLKPNHPKSARDKTWVLVIKDRKELREKLVPFFEKHPLYSQKWQEFLVFRKTLKLIEEKRHLTQKGFKEIVNLVFSLPRITNKRYSKEVLLSFF